MKNTETSKYVLWSFVATLFVVIRLSDGTFCYECADSTKNGDCESNFRRLRTAARYLYDENFTLPTTHSYLKDCTQWGNMCSVEVVSEGGNTVAFIRGCTNGSDFSVTPRKSPIPDNSTACSVYPEHDNLVVCITVCNTYLCNGPQYVFDGVSRLRQGSVWILTVWALMIGLQTA